MNAARPLPTGTVTFLFTDIEGSTRLLAALGPDYDRLLEDHARLLRGAIERHAGIVVGTEGDSFFAVFESTRSAMDAVVEAQRALAAHSWPAGAEVRVRMGLHTGEGRRGGDDYIGIDVNRTARIASAGHGGQVLVSEATLALIADEVPPAVEPRDLGHHLLKDLPEPEHLWQLDIAGLETTFPALRAAGTRMVHLPAPVSSFVGRVEVEAVARLLGSARLVTLTGPGGTGKTRLSIMVAGEVAPRFPHGTFFVALDPIMDPALVASEIATTLSLRGSEAPLERVITYLRERRALLVLDNLEQVIEAAPAIARITRECPDVSILATSRIPLRVDGEQEFPVPALSRPTSPADLDPEAAMEFEAVRLFVERAAASRPGFRLDAASTPVVADIVARVDGLPLAIELAAARLRSLPLEDLRARLDSRLGTLTGGARDAPERQRTLRAAIEWSHGLLDGPDRTLFARFSVMAGGADVMTTESVCDPRGSLGRDVLAGLESLTDQSLLVAAATEATDARFSMLATMREFATERLEGADEAAEVRSRHADVFLELAEEAAPHLLGADGADWNDRLEVEHDNLRGAADRLLADGHAGKSLRLVVALWRFWQVRGHLHEGARRSAAALALPSVAELPAASRARAHSAAGGIAYWRVDHVATYRHYAAALEAAREAGDDALLAGALYDAGFQPAPDALEMPDRFRRGRPLFEAALELNRRLDDRAGIASSLWALGFAEAADHELERAIELGRESLRISREIGDPFRTGWAAHLVGFASAVLGRYGEAARMFTESLDIWTSGGDKSGTLLLLYDVAVLAGGRGRAARRWMLVGAVMRMRDETGTDIVSQEFPFAGFDQRIEPEQPSERDWYEAGEALSMTEAIELAREELTDDGEAGPSGVEA